MTILYVCDTAKLSEQGAEDVLIYVRTMSWAQAQQARIFHRELEEMILLNRIHRLQGLQEQDPISLFIKNQWWSRIPGYEKV